MPSKLGPHAIRPTPEAVDWARVAPVVKAIDDTTALRQATRATIRLFRHYFPLQDITRSGAWIVDEVLRALGDAPATHVELYNETAQRVGQNLEDHVAITREAVAHLRAVRPDLTLVAFSFSTGQPEREDWEYLRQQEYAGATCIGLHEYWGAQGFTPWHALRHRTVHEWTGGDHPPFLITECGRDRVEGGKGGWKADGLTEEAYLTELLAYEGELVRDAYVIAATPFTGGPTPDWRAFDTDPISGRLAALSGPLPPTPEVPMPVLHGIDVSNNNGHVDLGLVKASGVSFVAMKASGDEGPSGVFLDAVFPSTWRDALALGLVRIAYHYGKPSRTAPAQSVSTLERALDAVGGLLPGDLIALDLEDPDVPDGTSLHAWTAEWLDLAERTFGVAPGKYSARYYTLTHDLEHADLERWWTWWASWQATMPDGVTGWRPIAVWQNSAHASVPGVAGECDTDVFVGTADQLRALGLPGSAGPSEPAPAGFDVDAARDVLWAVADDLERNGYPWFGQNVKAAVAQSKQER